VALRRKRTSAGTPADTVEVEVEVVVVLKSDSVVTNTVISVSVIIKPS
jgi:hypothetical protein